MDRPKDENILLSIDFGQLITLSLEHYSLYGVTIGSDFLTNYDMSLVQFKTTGTLFNKKPKNLMERETVFQLKEVARIISNPAVLEQYIQVLMSPGKTGKVFLDPGNFIISKDRVVSRDYRLLVHDHKGNIPEDIMLNMSSVALLMLSGKCDQARGYAYINEMLKRFGKVEFTFQMNGYMHIEIGRDPVMQYRSYATSLGTPSKG